MAPLTKILIANRGEVALRVARTARSMGIATVAVFSDADADATFVRAADEAVRIGPPPAAESYLAIDKLIDAAKRTGADAVHPGFGFLAENAAFAEACAAAGLVFIGPSPRAIRDMGSKKAAKSLVAAAGVPVIPGYAGDDQSVAGLVREAKQIGFPILIKASAGGGGKGMRIQRDAADLEAAVEGARREARNAFGDDTLLIERYVERPRHVEIQILGDTHGNLIHLFERECSIQRRHQKIIEETPSPALDAALRQRMGEAAVLAGKSVDYHSAGTVEFILAPDGAFYFLEVNTRLQVEHPITECVTGVDIVREQIRVAQGEALELLQADVRFDGAAIECRLYAEDPDNGFLPTTGTIVDWQLPALDGLRVDSGVETGSDVGIHYDPMLAKIIVHAPGRAEAIQKMIRALSTLSVQGVKTNRAFLIDVLSHPEFAAGRTHTHFIEDHLAGRSVTADADLVARAAIAATLFDHQARRRSRKLLPALEPGFRNNRFAPEHVEYAIGDRTLRVEYDNLGQGRFRVWLDGAEQRVLLVSTSGAETTFEDGAGVRRRVRVVQDGLRWHTHQLGGDVVLVEAPRFPERARAVAHGACIAPMPGKVVRVLVSQGQTVSAGDALVILEAMKMEHTVKAPEDGTVTGLHVEEGEQVSEGAVLAVVGDVSA